MNGIYKCALGGTRIYGEFLNTKYLFCLHFGKTIKPHPGESTLSEQMGGQ